MERVIPITIRDKVATAPRDALYVCGNSDYTINFTFDEEWEGFNEKTARFVYNGQFVDMIFSGNVCPVPIISNTYAFEVGVYVGNLSTTTKAYVPATKSVLCGSNIPAEPVSVYVPSSELEKKADKEYVRDYVDERVHDISGSNVYAQPDEPADAPEGSHWLDTDEEPESSDAPKIVTDPDAAQDGDFLLDPSEDYVLRSEMESYVDSAIQTALAAIPIGEEMLFG